MRPQPIPASYRNPYGALNQRRAIEIEDALRDIELDVLCLRLDAVQRATLARVLERFGERWPKERGW